MYQGTAYFIYSLNLLKRSILYKNKSTLMLYMLEYMRLSFCSTSSFEGRLYSLLISKLFEGFPGEIILPRIPYNTHSFEVKIP